MLTFLAYYLTIGFVVYVVGAIGNLIWSRRNLTVGDYVKAAFGVTLLWPFSVIGFIIGGVRRFVLYMERS